MARIRIVGMVFLMLFACQAQQYLDRRCSTTNDVDEILTDQSFEGRDWWHNLYVLRQVSKRIGFEAKTNDVSALRRHVFHRVLDLKVTTNKIIVAGYRVDSARRLLDKAAWVAEVVDEWCPGTILAEEDILGMLVSATNVCSVTTNDLEALRLAAWEKDRALGWTGKEAGSLWSPYRANRRAWVNERDWRNRWNSAVEKYRCQMVALSIKRLNILWKDMAEPERKRRIKQVVESFGLEMPEDDFSVTVPD